MGMFDNPKITCVCSGCLEVAECVGTGFIGEWFCKPCAKKEKGMKEILEVVGWRKVPGYTGGVPDKVFASL